MQLEFLFGANSTFIETTDNRIQLNLKSELLGERNLWNVLNDVEVIEENPNKLFFGNTEILGGIFVYELDSDLTKNTFTNYHELLEKSKGYYLCRAWNLIPGITERINGEMVYEMYNAGRSDAFYEFFNKPKIAMPAATGIDILGDKVVTVFIATKNKVEHFANPLQVDSFNYPEKYGKHAPSFARATKTKIKGKNVVFVSGTASIRGSESVFSDDELKQIDITIENIEVMLKQTHVFDVIKNGLFETEKIIYIKNKGNLEVIKKHILEKYPLFSNGIYLLSNICREELDIEISFTVREK